MRYLHGFVLMTIALVLLCGTAWAGGGPLGIDHRVTKDDSGIWQRKYQTDLMVLMIGGEIAGGVWEGGRDPPGENFLAVHRRVRAGRRIGGSPEGRLFA